MGRLVELGGFQDLGENMVEVTLAEAQQRLPELLAAAEAGEGVAIRGPSGRVFHLTAVRPRPPVAGVPKAGSCQGAFVVPKDFKAPLDELREYME
jgi:antitoxin (DNA-binding transcriptional repressor) of toxin-antitoxin stability system